ncbi:MAG: putative DNA-binding domain-containing protein [Gammaproteobacteria bacterium]|nr:putative DNA-binding domain-containing protein [Gammaproteobacteria bacterium]
MPSLRELQQEFMRALLMRGNGVIPGLVKQGAARGISAYRNTSHANLHNALRGVYPVIERLVGREFFAYAADAYMEYAPSTSGDLNHFGMRFPEFLRSFPPARALAYLVDVAVLERARHEVHDAAEADPVVPRHLATMAPEDYGRLVCIPHPATRLVGSPYPVLSIWERNQASYSGDPSVDLRQGGDDLLVRRAASGLVVVERLATADWLLLSRLAQGACLEEALNTLPDSIQNFDFTAALQRFFGDGVLIDVYLPISRRQK